MSAYFQKIKDYHSLPLIGDIGCALLTFVLCGLTPLYQILRMSCLVQRKWLETCRGKYSIDREDPAEMRKVEGNIKYLLRGCACKTGRSTTRCSCKKGGDICGPGHTCNNCTNHQESKDFHAGKDQADGIQTVNTSVSTSEDEAESNDEEYMETYRSDTVYREIYTSVYFCESAKLKIVRKKFLRIENLNATPMY